MILTTTNTNGIQWLSPPNWSFVPEAAKPNGSHVRNSATFRFISMFSFIQKSASILFHFYYENFSVQSLATKCQHFLKIRVKCAHIFCPFISAFGVSQAYHSPSRVTVYFIVCSDKKLKLKNLSKYVTFV
jgi:hypothetical protein